MALLAASSAASWAAKGVLFREPLKPWVPDEDHETTLPDGIGNGDYGVIKGRLNMGNTRWNILFFFFFLTPRRATFAMISPYAFFRLPTTAAGGLCEYGRWYGYVALEPAGLLLP